MNKEEAIGKLNEVVEKQQALGEEISVLVDGYVKIMNSANPIKQEIESKINEIRRMFSEIDNDLYEAYDEFSQQEKDKYWAAGEFDADNLTQKMGLRLSNHGYGSGEWVDWHSSTC